MNVKIKTLTHFERETKLDFFQLLNRLGENNQVLSDFPALLFLTDLVAAEREKQPYPTYDLEKYEDVSIDEINQRVESILN